VALTPVRPLRRGPAEALRQEDSPRTLVVPAPAKLNLFLHVTGRRGDGHHTLESLFVALDFGDTITLACRDDGAIVRTRDLPGITVDADLAVRAARALQRETATGYGVDIAIDKRIPQGGGLGGGSSDAATVLLSLNRLWRLGLTREDLMRIGLALGADVPFFVFGAPAVGRGIGERLTAVSLPPVWVVVLPPPIAVPTASIFGAPELTRATPAARIDVFSEGYGRNDLQAVAIARFPDIAAALARLVPRSPSARMTGSGGCVFASFASEAEASAALAAANDAAPGARGFVARTLARHPLAAFA
jgi:4-diphosphocytidyl-2-C-methyl-D-erythritol kinase